MIVMVVFYMLLKYNDHKLKDDKPRTFENGMYKKNGKSMFWFCLAIKYLFVK